MKNDSTKTINFVQTPTTDDKWYTYFHVSTTSMGDGELLAAGSVLALKVGDARSTAYDAAKNNCHVFELKPKNEGQHRIVVIHSICLRTVLQETKDMYITRKNLPSTSTSGVPLSLFQHSRTSPEQLENVSVLENGCLLTLLWKLGALSGNDLNNATQFSPSFICKDIVVPAVNRCGIGHVLR